MAKRNRHWGYWNSFHRSTPIRVEGGIKARSERGKFGDSWWADRWIQVLESFGWDTRLQRGRSYARRGQVLEYQMGPGLVTAKVQGSRPTPYDIEIKVKPLSSEEWDQVTKAMAGQAIFAAKLLAGEMPQNIEEAFAAAKLSLFPRSEKDLDTFCSCPDWANPCKHIAAVYYILGEEFDRDPFMIFQLRGRGREELAAALREERLELIDSEEEELEAVGSESGGHAEAQEVPPDLDQPLEECLQRFWEAGEEAAGFRVSVAPPTVAEAMLKRLGPLPLLKSPEDFTAILGKRYQTVTQRALEMAFREENPS